MLVFVTRGQIDVANGDVTRPCLGLRPAVCVHVKRRGHVQSVRSSLECNHYFRRSKRISWRSRRPCNVHMLLYSYVIHNVHHGTRKTLSERLIIRLGSGRDPTERLASANERTATGNETKLIKKPMAKLIKKTRWRSTGYFWKCTFKRNTKDRDVSRSHHTSTGRRPRERAMSDAQTLCSFELVNTEMWRIVAARTICSPLRVDNG